MRRQIVAFVAWTSWTAAGGARTAPLVHEQLASRRTRRQSTDPGSRRAGVRLILALLGETGVPLACSAATHRLLAGTRKRNANCDSESPSREVSLTPAQRTDGLVPSSSSPLCSACRLSSAVRPRTTTRKPAASSVMTSPACFPTTSLERGTSNSDCSRWSPLSWQREFHLGAGDFGFGATWPRRSQRDASRCPGRGGRGEPCR